jgi:hypothetical protein
MEVVWSIGLRQAGGAIDAGAKLFAARVHSAQPCAMLNWGPLCSDSYKGGA